MMESQYGYGVWFAVMVNVMLILFFALGFLAPRGERYLEYKKSVPAFSPRLWAKRRMTKLNELYT